MEKILPKVDFCRIIVGIKICDRIRPKSATKQENITLATTSAFVISHSAMQPVFAHAAIECIFARATEEHVVAGAAHDEIDAISIKQSVIATKQSCKRIAISYVADKTSCASFKHIITGHRGAAREICIADDFTLITKVGSVCTESPGCIIPAQSCAQIEYDDVIAIKHQRLAFAPRIQKCVISGRP